MRFYAIVGRGKMRICARLVFDEDIGRRVKTDSRLLLSAAQCAWMNMGEKRNEQETQSKSVFL